ncbi:transcriptional regulator [Aestuariimicrobium sp. Y1814]|uniref:transcriptional regulator n=1 Tax=Aestuariimicrobium sp. Y1814 TaxID=3418742 RepID=UPI003DA75726
MSAAIGLSSLALLSACGQDETTTEAPPTTATETTAAEATSAQSTAQTTASETSEPSATLSEDDKSQAPSQAKEVPINKLLKDTEVGDTITVISAIRGASYPSVADKIADGAELVLLQVKIVPSGDFGGLVAPGNFRLSKADGSEERYNSKVEDDMAADGKPVLDAPRREGEATGWIAYLLDEDEKLDTYEGTYTRNEAKVIGQDKTLAEFKGTFTIPAA